MKIDSITEEAIMFLDFRKAFDTIEIKCIRQSLNFFNFGSSFQKWVDVLYTDVESSIIQNGWSGWGWGDGGRIKGQVSATSHS